MTTAIETFVFRGITMMLWDNVTDSAGRTMYYVTVDGETVGKGYSAAQAKQRAMRRMA